MSIGYSALGTDPREEMWEAEARERNARHAREDAARKAAHEEMIAAIRRGENGGACPILASQYAGSSWLPVPGDHYGHPEGCGLSRVRVEANAIAAWAVENVPAPVYHDAESWFDAVARVAAGETKGMPGGKGSVKGFAYEAIDAYRAANPEPAATDAKDPAAEAEFDGIGRPVTIPSGPYRGVVGTLVGARKAAVVVFGRTYTAEW